MKNILFYKYVEINDPKKFQKEHQKYCDDLKLLGKVLVAKEGINGCVSGSVENIEAYKQHMRDDSRFSDLIFKEGDAKDHTFRKMFVKVRDEIITSHFGVDAKDAAQYVEPKQLKEWLDGGEEVVLIDARNDYETKIGMFENAIDPNLKNFQEWKEVPQKYANLKDKKVVTYCTGGIRCEKASAYLKKQGFSNVYQLHGGILGYGKECGNAHWKGECFVFDRRESVNIDPSLQDGELSESIKEKIAKEFGPGRIVGRVVNYYKRSQVAEVLVENPINKGDQIIIQGKTTKPVAVTITHMQEEDTVLNQAVKGQDVTFPLSEQVRQNDLVYVKN